MPPERKYVSIGNLDLRQYRVSERRYGAAIPGVVAATMGYNGLLLGATEVGVVADGNDADGRAKTFTSAGGGANQCGINGAVYAITQTRYDATLKFRFKLNQIVTQRFWGGLFSASPLGNDSLIGVAQSVGIRGSTVAAITNFVAYSSSAAAENISNFATAVPMDTAVHEVAITIKNNGAGASVKLDDQEVAFLANLPVITQNLGFCLAIQETAAAAKVMRVYYVEIDQGN